nr:hypothetical protein [uncultured Desulfuromonas sp.]
MTGQPTQGLVCLIDLKLTYEDSESGQQQANSITLSVDIAGLTRHQRTELHLMKEEGAQINQLRVDLKVYDWLEKHPIKNEMIEASTVYGQGTEERLHNILATFLDLRHEFRRKKEKEHHAVREKFYQKPPVELVCYSDSIGVGPFVKVCLGEREGEARLNRHILNEVRPYFTDQSRFLAKFQQARLLAEQHNESLAEKITGLWGRYKTEDNGPVNEQCPFEDIELEIAFEEGVTTKYPV